MLCIATTPYKYPRESSDLLALLNSKVATGVTIQRLQYFIYHTHNYSYIYNYNAIYTDVL